MAAAIGIIGGVVGAIGAIQQAKAQSDAANYQAAVARNNQIIAQQQAAVNRQEGAQEAYKQDMKSKQILGQEKAVLGAAGVDIESGSPRDIIRSQTELARVDALTVRANYERKAYGFDVEATNQKAQSQLYRMQASQAKTAGMLGAFSSILGGLKGAVGGGGGFSLS